ncbi:sensor domain-containing diguanylate cyclase [Rhizobium sp. FKY42]|uniref:GGDEF domain-containing protein n=1 Tax=Rhizobium sp. FKY42 TaxID=2562310 RepID=UPI0010C15771|nr:sensor domain-containing diguanylate cyclase [Rhizobium sp. FKY42]
MIDTRFLSDDKRPLRTLVDEALAHAPRKMLFPKELSDSYGAYSAEIKTRKALPAAAICLALFNFGLILDYKFAPHLIWQFLGIRFLASTLPILFVVWISGRFLSHTVRDWVIAAGLVWGAVMLNALVAMRGATAAHLAFSVGLYLIVINIVFHLAPRVATTLSCIVCLTTVLLAWNRLVVMDDQTILALTFLIAAAIITLVANFRHDATMRHLYLLILREQIRTQDMEQANQELSAISYTDALTGVSNRRRFDIEFELACQNAREQKGVLGLLLIDVDHFKRYNDTHGHPAGDACLKQVAARISDQIRREQDVIARIGGEEFAIILRETSVAGADRVASRIHTALRAEWPQGLPPVTVSIGLAIMTGSSTSTIMQAADTALYEAKERGRNRTITTALAA